LSEQHPRFWDCPTTCALNENKPFDISRNKFCDGCALKLQKDRFRQEVLKVWEQRLGKTAKQFRFENVVTTLNTVIDLENLPPEKLSVKSAVLLNVYLGEKQKAKSLEAWQREQEK
jgi:hypothetical protein